MLWILSWCLLAHLNRASAKYVEMLHKGLNFKTGMTQLTDSPQDIYNWNELYVGVYDDPWSVLVFFFHYINLWSNFAKCLYKTTLKVDKNLLNKIILRLRRKCLLTKEKSFKLLNVFVFLTLLLKIIMIKQKTFNTWRWKQMS